MIGTMGVLASLVGRWRLIAWAAAVVGGYFLGGWLVAGIAAVGGAYIVGGWRLALAVATLGVGWRAYARGRATGQAEVKRRKEALRERLREKYNEIDARPRDPDDAYDRLRDRARGR